MILAAKLQIIICINLEDADKSTFFSLFSFFPAHVGLVRDWFSSSGTSFHLRILVTKKLVGGCCKGCP